MAVFSRGLFLLLLLPLYSLAHAVTRTTNIVRRQNDVASNNFVSQEGEQLMVNGSTFNFLGTTAYWLPALNSDQDIDNTLESIAKAGFNAVRTWAFNDVDTIPENGTWFQSIQNGTVTINTGANGIQKLDTVLNLAQKHGIYVLPSLTNNWNPRPRDSINVTDPLSVFRFGRRDASAGNSLPRNALSNDYGGMDFYVRAFGGPGEHDQFYTNKTLLDAFKNYTRVIVSRFANHPNVLAWELANDPRCDSSVKASSGCTTQTVTRWHSEIAKFVKSIDPNHVVSTGSQGFFCPDCPKLFARPPPPAPRPRPSPAPGDRRRKVVPLTRKGIILERKEAFKRTRAAAKRSQAKDGIMIRGRWISTPTRRQDLVSAVGPAFDGSHGVDSEDIMAIPEIGLSSFMLFPDQNSYGTDDPNLPKFNNTLNQGLAWIKLHGEAGQRAGKPVALAAVGLVTQDNAQAFVPFNSTTALLANNSIGSSLVRRDLPQSATQGFATPAQATFAFSQWFQAGVLNRVQGMVQYQWTQTNLIAQPGTVIQTPTTPVSTSTGTSPNDNETGTSPNDGYGVQNIGSLQSTIQTIGQGFLPISPV